MRVNKAEGENRYSGLEIAVIGMAGRFPGANDINSFWENLRDGIESVTFFSDEELLEAGVDRSLVLHPDYVKARRNVEGKEYFDGAFFGYLPDEARTLDPQVRIFHECVWEALEDAGYHPGKYKGLIGLFAGSKSNINWEAYVIVSQARTSVDTFSAAQLRNKDFLPTFIAYKLNLRGPSVYVYTACSTSLMAIHLACRSLLMGECQIALAGGVTISHAVKSGYLHQQSMISSPDGHCRAFDIDATGTVGGDGATVVALKRLKNAIADGDHIAALIKGSASTNDGYRKMGFTAPSVDGQAETLRAALKMARVEPGSIGFIETHGTGTPLGDPVEIEALIQAYGRSGEKRCALGAVKTNIGHLDSAAGAAGFIKTVLALKHRRIPATLHFRQPNPKIDFSDSPFYVNTGLREWENSGGPLRAGVSSFGIGGTNVHVILEEAPQPEASSASREYQLLLFSARGLPALDRLTRRFRDFLIRNRDINLADVAYTLQTGRGEFPYRRLLVCRGVEEAVRVLESPGSERLRTFKAGPERRSIVFMFPGGGSQYVNMGRELYEQEKVFRQEMDRCFEIYKSQTGAEIKEVLYPLEKGDSSAEQSSPAAGERIEQVEQALPLLFFFEYALTRLLMDWGIKPEVMIGHSSGEYLAACVAGIFTLEDAIKLVTLRGKLMQQAPAGAMLSVSLSEKDLAPLLRENGELALAAVNAPSLCVVSGPVEAVTGFEEQLEQRGIEHRRLHISTASHSKLMEPILEEFGTVFNSISFREPDIPHISNLTGRPAKFEEIASPRYWCRHLRETVRFAHGVEYLFKNEQVVFIEVGPGKALSTFVRRFEEAGKGQRAVHLTRHPQEQVSDLAYLLDKIGNLWLLGITPDWHGFYRHERRYRLPLPTYPFEKVRYPLGMSAARLISRLSPGAVSAGRREISEWFYVPSWKRSLLLPEAEESPGEPQDWVFFLNDHALGPELVSRLENRGDKAVVVRMGTAFRELSTDSFIVRPQSKDDYAELFSRLSAGNHLPDKIVHMWNVGSGAVGGESLDPQEVRDAQNIGYYSLLNIAGAMGHCRITTATDIFVVTDGMQEVESTENLAPHTAPILGAVRVIPREYPHISCRSIDIVTSGHGGDSDRLPDQLFKEMTCRSVDRIIAYRGMHRWVRIMEPVKLADPDGVPAVLKPGGVYLITGGTGGMGLVFAEYLAKTIKPKLILTGRTPLPRKSERCSPPENNDKAGETKKLVDKLLHIEEMGAEILYLQVDVSDVAAMQRELTAAEANLGPVNGIIHAAGVADFAGAIQNRAMVDNEKVFRAKIYGTIVLDQLLAERRVDFLLLCSSLAAVVGPFGQVGYSAANLFQDALARYRSRTSPHGTPILSIGWDSWQEVGTEAAAEKRTGPDKARPLQAPGINPDEGIEVLKRSLRHLNHHVSYLAVSTREINTVLSGDIKPPESEEAPPDLMLDPDTAVERPALTTTFVKPSSATEKRLTQIWQGFFGINRIGTADDFFELGGDSLKAMTMAGIIHREFQVELLLVDFFAHPTIGRLGQLIDSSTKKAFTWIGNSEEKEYYSLSSAQKRLFVLQEMDPRSVAYNLSTFLTLRGDIDRERLESTFRKLIRRHESLRTSFHMVNDVPVQRIHRVVDFKIECHDDQGGAAEDGLLPALHGTPDFIRPFDLGRPPLLRVVVFGNSSASRLLLDLHHIITDGLSQAILAEDFGALFNGEALPRLRLRYRDYARWQSGTDQENVVKRQESYWMQLFADDIPVLNLPCDQPRPLVQSFDGGVVEFFLSEEETGRLKEMTGREGTTLFMSILSIFTVLLSKLSGQEDIVVGSPIAGRRHPDLKGIVGMFVNTLALRNFPGGDKSFIQFTGEVKEQTLLAFENQDYQFEDLVDRLSVSRDTGRNPLFDVMFNLLSKQDFRNEIPGPDNKRSSRHRRGISKFDLTLTAVELEERVLCSFEYSSILFKPETVDRIVVYFRQILNSLSGQSNLKISRLELITEKEKHQILSEFNDTGLEYPAEKTIQELFEVQVDQHPDHIALECDDEHITYEKLNSISNRLAGQLRSKGVSANEIVALIGDRSVEVIMGMMGTLKAGGGYLPIDPNYPTLRRRYMLADSDASVLLMNRRGVSEAGETAADFPEDRLLFMDDTELCSGGEANLDSLNISRDLAYIIYTSGTTGRPRGVMIEHRSVVNFIFSMTHFYDDDFDSRDRCLSATNFCFDVSVCEIFMPLNWGARIVLLAYSKIFDPDALADTILSRLVTFTYIPPGLLRVICERLESKGTALALNKMLVGVEPIEDHTLEAYLKLNPRLKIVNGYGPTEATICATAFKYHSHRPQGGRVPIGIPLGNTGVYLLDKFNHLVPAGIPGELCIGGAGLSRGYLGHEELNAEKFVPHPFKENERIYKTGDLARWLSDGNILFIGRIDAQVKIRGFRVELGEIESQLLTCKSIKSAVVLASKSDRGTSAIIRQYHLCAYLVSDNDVNLSDLREYLSSRLPDYMIPSYFIQIDRIPLTSNGKVDKRALPAPELKADLNIILPRDAVEMRVARSWSEILGIEPGKIGINDNFFQLGGHSLRATVLVSRLHQALNVKIPLAEIFKSPTIRQLSDYIKKSAVVRYTPIRAVERRDYYTLSSSQKRLYILQQLNAGSTAYHLPHTMMLDHEVDGDLLQQTFRQLIDRHESFRTAFHLVDGEPVQRVLEAVEFRIEFFDLVSGDQPLNGSFEKKLIKDFVRPFDLSRPPLLRVGLIKQEKRRYILMVDMHHIISDAVSMDILIQDFKKLGDGYILLELPIQYKDYACWQNSRREGDEMERLEAFWMQEFDGDIPVLDLPTDYPRPREPVYRGGNLWFAIDDNHAADLMRLAADTGTTLYMVMLALFYFLLSRVGNREDIVVGTPVAGRLHADLEGIIGMFVNTLALRAYPAGDKPFIRFLDEVKSMTLRAFENQDFQFEDLVEKIVITRDSGRNPLFDVMFELVNIETPAGDSAATETTARPNYNKLRDQTSKFDMTWRCIQRGSKLTVNISYDVELYKETSIERFAGYYLKIVATVLENRETTPDKIQVFRDLFDRKLNVPTIDINF